MRRGDHVPQAFQAPVDVHASADGQVYMFKRRPNDSAASSDDDDEEGLSVMEMKPRVLQKQDRLRHVHLLEREVSAGDSLNKLALQYGCQVADIKRVNNLIQEQDLFALKSIKIPVPKHSFLIDTYSDPRDSQEELPHSSTPAAKPLHRAGPHRRSCEPTDFLTEVDNDIERLIQTADDGDADVFEESEKQQRCGFRAQRLIHPGADWGIQWWNAVIAMLLIVIVLPLFYVIYFKTKHSGAVPPTDGSAPFLPSTTGLPCSGTLCRTPGAEHFQEHG